ncbi:ATP-dependent nuclease [Burkholderia sp. LMU1-1-1.1]|uniref:ATP-dependent nuclease n=1 Tax=Burkholderia sp. LMU1-1-1.1 TaxID=3135266 RepID=UPI003423D343
MYSSKKFQITQFLLDNKHGLKVSSALAPNSVRGDAEMYLADLTISGFRKVRHLKLSFQPGLNIIVGENNAGKTAVVDGLRALLTATEEGNLRLDETDLHVSGDGNRSNEIVFSYVFKGLSPEDEADFVTALKPSEVEGKYEAHFGIRYSTSASGRLRPKRWCGAHEENSVSPELLEDLRAIYLQPLRDPASGLRPSRSSQIARLLARLSTPSEKEEIVNLVRSFEQELEAKGPVTKTSKAITAQHKTMLGEELSQSLSVGLTAPDFQRIAARLKLNVDEFDVEQNGLGFNNLIYMAVVLSELETNPDALYRALIIEEPEAHLHPQLQAVLLQFLQEKEKVNPHSIIQSEASDIVGLELPVDSDSDASVSTCVAAVQIFVTSHSPNFASIANLDTLCCIHRGTEGVRAFSPRKIQFSPLAKKSKLQRYLDVTRAELFFARRVVLVEGTAELFLFHALARCAGFDLRKRSVSLLSTEGLNFDCFLPLFGENALNIKVALITDGDPASDCYPELDELPKMSSAAQTLEAHKSESVGIFIAAKTLEYDLALHTENHALMLAALKELHPTIASNLEDELKKADPRDKARILFNGMFQREKGTNVLKGKYAQSLAGLVGKQKTQFKIPPYLLAALEFITRA